MVKMIYSVAKNTHFALQFNIFFLMTENFLEEGHLFKEGIHVGQLFLL